MLYKFHGNEQYDWVFDSEAFAMNKLCKRRSWEDFVYGSWSDLAKKEELRFAGKYRVWLDTRYWLCVWWKGVCYMDLRIEQDGANWGIIPSIDRCMIFAQGDDIYAAKAAGDDGVSVYKLAVGERREMSWSAMARQLLL